MVSDTPHTRLLAASHAKGGLRRTSSMNPRAFSRSRAGFRAGGSGMRENDTVETMPSAKAASRETW